MSHLQTSATRRRVSNFSPLTARTSFLVMPIGSEFTASLLFLVDLVLVETASGIGWHSEYCFQWFAGAV